MLYDELTITDQERLGLITIGRTDGVLTVTRHVSLHDFYNLVRARERSERQPTEWVVERGSID